MSETPTSQADGAESLAEVWHRQAPFVHALCDDTLQAEDRLRALATTLRNVADALSPVAALIGEPAALSNEDLRHLLSGLAELLDPDLQHGERLVFARRRKGNPRVNDVLPWLIIPDVLRVYRQMVADGWSRQGLKKRVSDLIGKRYGLLGATVDKLWHAPKMDDDDRPLHQLVLENMRRQRRAARAKRKVSDRE